MSLILDALNRAEHDRKNKNAVPDINTVHVLASPVVAQPKVKPMLVLITISLVVIAVILSVWLFRSSSTAVSPLVVSPPQVTASPQVATPQQATTPQQIVAESQHNVNPVAAVSQSQTVAPAVENLYAEKSAAEKVPDASVEKLYEPEVAEPISESVSTPFEPTAQIEPTEQSHAADFAAVIGATQQVIEPQTPEQLVTGMAAKPQRYYDEIDVQDFNSLGWNQKQQIPTLSYSRHNYLPQNVSTVVINGETLGEGNAFGGGSFVVDEIFVDGVVLSFRGNKFKLRALSGWVNM